MNSPGGASHRFVFVSQSYENTMHRGFWLCTPGLAWCNKKIVTVNNITYLVNRNAWKSDICWHCNWWCVKIIQILTWPSRDWQPKEEQNNLMCFGVLHPQFWWARTAYYKPSLWLHAFMVSALSSWWNLDIKRDGDDFSLWLPFRFNWS